MCVLGARLSGARRKSSSASWSRSASQDRAVGNFKLNREEESRETESAMGKLSRRDFCSKTAGTVATAATAALGAVAFGGARRLMAQTSALEVELEIDSATSLAKVPEDYMGLSYESGQLAYPDFFSPENTALIRMFRRLSPTGVLRLGGNLSEFTLWSDTDPATPPDLDGLVGPDPGHREPRTFTITPRSIRNLHGFLRCGRLAMHLWPQSWRRHSGAGACRRRLCSQDAGTATDRSAVRERT